LAKLGIASLAIDTRGHGESTLGWNGVRMDYRQFTDVQHQEAFNDAMAGMDWIRGRGLGAERIAVGGASFGANIALWLMNESPSLNCGVMLSAGSDYRGTNAVEFAKNLLVTQSVFLAASEEDKESFQGTKAAFDAAYCEKKVFMPYKGAGHGTDILKKDPGLNDKISDWVWNIFRG
jgi:dienelactone hydrolase